MHDLQSRTGKNTAAGLGLAASLMMLLVSAYLNARYMYALGRSPMDGYVYAGAGIAADVFMALAPFFFFAALKSREIMRGLFALVLWVGVTAFSAQSAIGHLASSRLDAASGRAVAATTYQDAREDLKQARQALGFVPAHRPIATVQADLEKQKINRAWSQTNECTQAFGNVAKTYCSGIKDLMAELGNAMEAEKIRKRIETLTAKSDAVSSHNAVVASEADPQAKTLSVWFGKDVGTMQGWISLLGAMVLLMGAGIGPYVSLAGMAEKPPRSPKEAPPAALATEGGLLLDMSPGPPQALTRAPQIMLPPAREIPAEAKDYLRSIGMPDRPCDRREKDARAVLGYRFYAWLIFSGYSGDFTAEAIDSFYEAYSMADNRAPWPMRIVKKELEDIGQRYVSSGLRLKQDGTRGTMWSIKPVAFTKLLDLLRKRGIVTETPKAPEPVEAVQEPVAEAAPPMKNVYRLFGRVTDEAKKASG